MEKRLLKINQKVPPNIFDIPKIKVQVDSLFSKMEDEIKSRFNEIKTFITGDEGDNHWYSKVSYDDISDFFKMNFYKLILNEAVKMAFTETGKYNVADNILELLCEENMKNAILGEPMVSAVNRSISNLPSDSALTTCSHGSKMILIEMEFLGKSFPT